MLETNFNSATQNIFPPMEKTRSCFHLISSDTPRISIQVFLISSISIFYLFERMFLNCDAAAWTIEKQYQCDSVKKLSPSLPFFVFVSCFRDFSLLQFVKNVLHQTQIPYPSQKAAET